MVVKVDKMSDIPVGNTPNRHYPVGNFTEINDRFSVTTFDHASNVIIVTDRLTGKSRKMTFPTEIRVEKKAKNKQLGITLVDIKA